MVKTMDNYEEYEKQCKRIRTENEGLLEDFVSSLEAAGLSKKTVDSHVTNVAFYIDHFLLYEEAIAAQEGLDQISVFLGYWFIKKAMWASQDNMRGNAASLKKFYAFLCGRGLVSQEDLAELNATIKQGLPGWLNTLKRYDDPEIDNPWE
jgi:site-specific recombinase XerD